MDKNNFRRTIKNRLSGYTCTRGFMRAPKPVLRDQGSSDAVHSVRATCTRVHGVGTPMCVSRVHALANAVTHTRALSCARACASSTTEKSKNANVRAS